jgi:hypothetical protein
VLKSDGGSLEISPKIGGCLNRFFELAAPPQLIPYGYGSAFLTLRRKETELQR